MKPPPLKKLIPLLTTFFFFLFVVLMGYTIIAQTILIPQAISKQYNQYLQPDLNQLRTKFKAVSDSTQLAIYNDPYSDAQAGHQDLLATQKLVTEAEQSLTNYEQQANLLPSTPFAPHTEAYRKAEVVRAKANDVFLQSREVLNGYKALIAYFLQLSTARTVLQSNTADINSLANLNQLAGQGNLMARRAAQLGDTVAAMKQLHPPAEYKEYHAVLVTTLEQSQAGLTQLSRGLNARNDTQINAGANVLGQAISNYESNGGALFTTASENSAVLKETSRLADKIYSLQPFLAQ